MTRVLMLLKTTGLEYDDRVRKECLSLVKLGMEPCVGVLDDSNRRREGTTAYGVRFTSVRLSLRRVSPSARGLILKTIELYIRFFRIVLRERPSILWIHDMTMGGFVPVAWLLKKTGRLKRLVWDQHELPSDGMWESRARRKLFAWAMSLCDAVISANQERMTFLEERIGGDYARLSHVLQNFPDADFVSCTAGELPDSLKAWLEGQPYLLSQGGGDFDRRLEECCDAIIRLDGVKLVVVGRYKEQAVSHLRSRWEESFDANIHFTGMMPQRRIIDYVDHALASIVLYGNLTRNSWLCAPNRLYQAVARGTPVIVGCNPPLAHFIQRTGAGVTLQHDGSDVEDLMDGIQRLMTDRTKFAGCAHENRSTFLWHTQNQTIAELLYPGTVAEK